MSPKRALAYLIVMGFLGTTLIYISNNSLKQKELLVMISGDAIHNTYGYSEFRIPTTVNSTMKQGIDYHGDAKVITLNDNETHHPKVGVCTDILRKYYKGNTINFMLPKIAKRFYILHNYDNFPRDFGIGSIFTKAKITPLLAQVHSGIKVIWNPDLFQTYTHGSGNMMEYFVDKEKELGYLSWICYRMKHSLNITQYTYTLTSTYSKNTPCIMASLEGKIKENCFEDFFQKTIAKHHDGDIIFLLEKAPSLDHWNTQLADYFRVNYENIRLRKGRTNLPYETSGHFLQRDLIIAMHVRRGDILNPRNPAFVSRNYSENLLRHLLPHLKCGNKTFKGVQIHLFSQGNLSDFQSIGSLFKHNVKLVYHLTEGKGGLIEQIDEMTHADILITSKGGFTHLIAALAPKDTIILAVPYWQNFDGIQNVLLTNEKDGSFDKEKFAHTFCRIHF